jgi:hypothetical protein
MRRRILNAEQGLWRLLETGRPFETHNSTTASWTILSYSINPVVWYVYYHLLQDFLDVVRTQENSERLPLYIRANVIFPWNVISHTLVRHTIYSLFYRNTPPEFYHCIHFMRFRLFFISTNAYSDNEIRIERMTFETTYSQPFYYDLYCEQ